MFEKIKLSASGLLVSLLAIGTLGLVSVATAEPASASAFSCTGYGIGWRYGRPAQFCGDTQGSGLYIRTVGAGFSSPVGWAGVVCNARVKVEFIDTSGNVYASRLSSQQNGCSTVGGWKWAINAYARQGLVRYTLLSNGATIAVVEHRINP